MNIISNVMISLMEKNADHIKIIPLGGVEEIGINCTAIEYKGNIIVIDCGLGFPENDQLGIDYIIPNIDYLERNKSRIRGIYITHSHYDHIGALDVVLPKLDFPNVYAPAFAAELIKHRFTESKIVDKVKVITYKESNFFKITKDISLTFFKVNHSTPDSYGFIFLTPIGKIIHTGDFKVDNSPVDEKPINLTKIAKYSSDGVLALLSDSTNSFRKGFSKSEYDIIDILRDVVEKANGRVIVATFSQLVTRINQLLQLAVELDKKVAISGRSLDTALKIARDLGYIKIPDTLIVPLNKISQYPKHKQMIFTTGHQGETMAALSRIARGEHKDVKIEKGDNVIMSSSVIPGNEVLVQKMIDDLSVLGAKVIHQGIMDLHAGGHGYQEDQKLMLNIVRPKFFIPVHGYQSFLAQHGQTAVSVGVKEENVMLAKKGREIIITKNSIKVGKQHRSTPIIVSGLGVGDIGTSILTEREKLGSNGIVIILVDLMHSTCKVETRGFAFEQTSQVLLEEIRTTSQQIVNSSTDRKAIKPEIESKLFKLIQKKLQREPLIHVIIN